VISSFITRIKGTFHLSLQQISIRRIQQLAAARIPVDSGQHTWICRSIDYSLNLWYNIEIASTAHVAMKKVDSRRPEWRAILFAACAKEIIDTPDLDP
jgi:hypothetical protein